MHSRADLEHLSLFYYIKEGILAPRFSQELQEVDLVLDSTLYNNQIRTDYKIADPEGPFGVIPSSRGRGWLSFKAAENQPCEIMTSSGNYVSVGHGPLANTVYTIPQERESTYISVRDQNNNVMDRSWYEIDYDKGRIRFPAPTTPSGVVTSGLEPTKLDYRFHVVSTLDGWPTDEQTPINPTVAIYPVEQTFRSYQIGGGVEFQRDYEIVVFGTSTTNRRSILNELSNGFHNKHAPVIDFNRGGTPLKHWGVINEEFIKTIELNGENYKTYLTLNPSNGNILYFFNIKVIYDFSPRGTMEDSMRHMGKIKLTTCTYSDRDPQLIGRFRRLPEPPGGFDSLTVNSYSS